MLINSLQFLKMLINSLSNYLKLEKFSGMQIYSKKLYLCTLWFPYISILYYILQYAFCCINIQKQDHTQLEISGEENEDNMAEVGRSEANSGEKDEDITVKERRHKANSLAKT